MVRNVAVLTWYVCRRKRCDLRPGEEDGLSYRVWLVLVVCPERADTASEAVLNDCLDLDTADEAVERLKEAVAEVLAGRLEGAVWKTADDLSADQVAGLLAGLPDMIKTIAEKPLGILGGAAGLSAPVVSFGADIAATLVLKPTLEPLQSTVHVLEVVGIVLGLAAGMHPLVITCVKHLAYDEFGGALTHAFEQIMSPTDAQALDTQPPALRPGTELSPTGKSSAAPAGPGHGTAVKSLAYQDPDSGNAALRWAAESATKSVRSRNRTAADDPQSAIPRQSIPTVTGTPHRDISGTVNIQATGQDEIKQARRLADALKALNIGLTEPQDDARPLAATTGLLRDRAASATESADTVSNPYTAS